jgi:glycosyltransferase involved in cell wall biosynthesis
MPGLVIAALRDLDPPAGGAEMSLATLLEGVTEPGPGVEAEVLYAPCHPSPDVDPALLKSGWRVRVHQSSVRGEGTELADVPELRIIGYPLKIEDIWSGLAWRLRGKDGQPNGGLQARHLRKANHLFCKKISAAIKTSAAKGGAAGLPVVGVTQLHWSAGAAECFQTLGIPYVVFVRDELQFRQPDIYRSSLENAAAVCCAGEGLGAQVASTFNVKAIRNVRLPVDFAGRFGSADDVAAQRADGLATRLQSGDAGTPRIAIVGVTPEKGYEFYQRLLPHLASHWPEAHIDIHGGGSYAESLGNHYNATWHGHTAVEEVFSKCDVHLLTVASTGSWGRVINEAGLFGVPSVSVAIGSQPEAVGAGGIVVPESGSLGDWTSALRTTYENRVALGEAARLHAGVVDHRSSIAAFRSVLHEFIG